MESELGLPGTSVKAGRKIKGLSDTEMADLVVGDRSRRPT